MALTAGEGTQGTNLGIMTEEEARDLQMMALARAVPTPEAVAFVQAVEAQGYTGPITPAEAPLLAMIAAGPPADLIAPVPGSGNTPEEIAWKNLPWWERLFVPAPNVVQLAAPAISGGGAAKLMGDIDWSQLISGVSSLAGGLAAGAGGAAGKGKLIGGTVMGTGHGLLQIKTSTGNTVWVKRAKHRRYGRRGGGGGGFKSMIKDLAMMKMISKAI